MWAHTEAVWGQAHPTLTLNSAAVRCAARAKEHKPSLRDHRPLVRPAQHATAEHSGRSWVEGHEVQSCPPVGDSRGK